MTMISKRPRIRFLIGAVGITVMAQPVWATENASVKRSAPDQVSITWTSNVPVDVFVTQDPVAPISKAQLISEKDSDGSHIATDTATSRSYFLLRNSKTRKVTMVAERLFPLEQGSNFRDEGGYLAADGKRVKWGKIFRSGAMPLLSEKDYTLISGLKIKSIVDLRSLDEREVAPTELDDRTGALFLSNDYSLKKLMTNSALMKGETIYAGMEKMLRPQYRVIFARLLAADGAVLYNCSAGQDRTGVASALILSALGVDRETIIKDYHLSTPSRRTQWEMPQLNPADYPGNFIVQYYASAAKKPGGVQAEPLYSKSGVSHLIQFFAYLETEYGGVESYLQKELNVGPEEIKRLRALYLES